MECSGCGRRLYFHERVWRPQEFCLRCATARGIRRLCDTHLTDSDVDRLRELIRAGKL